MAILIKYIVMGSVILMMLGVGLRTPFGDVLQVAKRFGLVARGVAANFLLVPAAIYLGMLWLPFDPEIQIGILLMAAAPIAPMAPPFVGMARGDLAYAVGLMTVVALLSVPLTPMILSLTLPGGEGAVSMDPLEVIQTLLIVQLIPVSVGMGIRHASEEWTERLLGFVPRVGQVGLLVGVGMLLVKQAEQILAIGLEVHVFLIVVTCGSLLIGEVMMWGQPAAMRSSLAITTAIRNVPLAFLLANSSFPGSTAAPVTLLFTIFNMLLAVAYGRLRPAAGDTGAGGVLREDI